MLNNATYKIIYRLRRHGMQNMRRENTVRENYSFESNFSEEIMKNVLGLFILLLLSLLLLTVV